MAKIRGLCSMIHSKYDSEAAFARELGWPRQRLNKITTGVKEPDIMEAAQIARGLNISVDDVAQFFLNDSSPIRRINPTDRPA